MIFRLKLHKIECSILKSKPVETITADEKNHAIFTAVGCIRVIELKKEDKRSFTLLKNLSRRIDKIKSDKAASENLSDVKKILSSFGYSEADIEESYSLLKLYGYTLPDVEDSKVDFAFLKVNL